MSESRQRIIDAANDLFQGGSFHVVGIAEICDTARVNRGTFYHFFPSKIGLLVELIDLYVEALLREYATIASGPAQPEEKIRQIFSIPRGRNEAWKKAHGMAAGCFIGNVCLEMATQEPFVRERAEWAFKSLSLGLEPIVREFSPRVDTNTDHLAAKAQMVMGVMQGAQVIAKATNDPSIFVAYGELVVEMLKARAASTAAA